MTSATMLPTVFILRQALDVIRRESLAFDVETGGILLGARSDDGALLVTHATPPGPNAVHDAVFFERDVAYQQAALEDLHARYGVDYLGEWHKHPRGMPVPSRADLEGVKKLLADPDYGVNSILFPIVICERDLGFQIHPFYASQREPEVRFQPIAWQELTVGIDPDRIFGSDGALSAATSLEASEASTNSTSPPAGRAASAWSWLSIRSLLPFCGSQHEPELIGQACDDDLSDPEPHSAASQWYETEDGRERLRQEQFILKSFGLSADPFLLPDQSLCLSFPRTGRREIVVVCARDHPDGPPQVFVKQSGPVAARAINGWAWEPDKYLADVVVPLLGPDCAKRRSGA